MAEWVRTIAGVGSVELVIKKSRFICTVERVSSEEEARAFVARLKKQHWDANHNCSAWVIGERGELQRSNDDGEPSGTAGSPMLEVLKRRNITDTVAVVTRYFGGTLLGAGGLIRAYGSAVSEAIDTVGIVERQPLTIVNVEAIHQDAGKLDNALRASPFQLGETHYGESVTFEVQLADGELDPFQTWLAEATGGRAISSIVGVEYVEVPVPMGAPT
jgi:uncharacterized YigZ family protein